METKIITKAEIKGGKFIGGLLEFKGNIELGGDLGWVAFTSLRAEGYIWAKAGTGIKAGSGIKAGRGIEAGEGIEAGWGIEAGANISVKLRIFAGLIMWRKPKDEEMIIKCKRLKSGEVAYGKLIEEGKLAQ